MNKVSQFLLNITDEELVTCIAEIKELHDTGILCYGMVRALASALATDLGVTYQDAASLIQNGVLIRAAYNFAGLKYGA